MSSQDFPNPPPEANPYRAPVGDIAANYDAELGGDLERIRRTYLSHEASIKSIGSLYILGSVLNAIGLVLILAGISRNDAAGFPGAEGNELVAVRAGVGFVQMIVGLLLGYGLIKLKTWARWTVAILTGLGFVVILFGGLGLILLNPAVGLSVIAIVSLILGYILYLLLSPKASVIFTPQYRAVVEKTPHIKYKTSPILKFFLILVVGLIVLAVGAALLRR